MRPSWKVKVTDVWEHEFQIRDKSKVIAIFCIFGLHRMHCKDKKRYVFESRRHRQMRLLLNETLTEKTQMGIFEESRG